MGLGAVGVVGGSGFTGRVVVACLRRHPYVVLTFVACRRPEEERRYWHAMGWDPAPLCGIEEALEHQVDWVIVCLPHGESARWVERWVERRGVRVIDLSGDFRFPDPTMYTVWYGQPHPAPARLRDAVLVLPEWNVAEATSARIVANPGCYPTSVWLPLIPLLREGLLESDVILIDAKSGVTGAGRSPSERTHFVTVHENFTVYSAGRRHRHVGEIEYYLHRWTGADVRVVMTTGLLPIRRGLMSTLYVKRRSTASAHTLWACLRATYADRPTVRVWPFNEVPSVRDVVGTQRCDIGVVEVTDTPWVVIVSVLDNLLKGAGGQAIQTLNALQGWDETVGLPLDGGEP